MNDGETRKFESRDEIMESLSKERNLAGADMSGLDLSGIKLLGLSMKGADLHDSNLANARTLYAEQTTLLRKLAGEPWDSV